MSQSRKCDNCNKREKLSSLKLNQKGKITSVYNDNKAVKQRLLDMGLTTGTIVMVKKIAPMGDPVDITIRGYELCLRRADMQNIEIEVLD